MDDNKMMEPIKKRGLFYCPYACGDKRYPRTKWKTEKGAIKHINNCLMAPDRVAAREAIELKRAQDRAANDEIALSGAKYKVGDEVKFIQKYIINPIYKRRFNRMVKVRYEDEYRFRARKQIIKTIGIINGAVCYNGFIFQKDIRVCSFGEVEDEAIKLREEHLEWLKMCSDLR